MVQTAYAGETKTLFVENFDNLDNWRPLHFPKIEKYSLYTIETKAADSYLKAESNVSASAIVYKKKFNVYEFPRVSWQWKVEHVYQKGDAKTKAGDDYPLRIYIIFEYNPDKAGLWDKLKYKAAKLIYGEYPPHSSLNYIWANKKQAQTIITSAYTKKSKMILVQAGNAMLGKWLTYDVDIVEDYQKAFGTAPPKMASIAIMNDSDNTGENSISYINYVKVYRK